MSLFPAYAADASECLMEHEVSLVEVSNASPTLEAQLLASDNDEEREPPVARKQSSVSEEVALLSDEFYLDRKFDGGNLRVSTLYYPGRPQYERVHGAAVGARGQRGARGAEGARWRYWRAPPPADEGGAGREARDAAWRAALDERPHHAPLWLRYLDYQERCVDAASALRVAEEACAACGAGGGGSRLRAALHRLRAAVLPHARRTQLLREHIAHGGGLAPRLELWVRLVSECGRAGGLHEAERAALGAVRALPAAYPHVLYAYGAVLRAAGLWERLVLLLELTLAMNFPPAAFPPPALNDPARLHAADQTLLDAEDKVISSGLPLSTVWVRVERLRAAAHWRAAPRTSPRPAPGDDPQRTPLAADVAELVLPVQGARATLLLVQALRLANVPPLPASSYVVRALSPDNEAAGDWWGAARGEALLGVLRAARRLPPAHPARAHPPAAAPRALALLLDPPHYFNDDNGFLSWVSALWEACCAWAAGEARVALLCWRLRWLHALLLAGDARGEGAEEARRVRGEARAALKRWAGASPLPYVQFARIEREAVGPEAALRVALHAARSALREPATPAAHRLYAARVVWELDERAGLWATASAARAAPLPDDERLAAPPPPHVLHDALVTCERECAELEARLGCDGEDEGEDGDEAEDEGAAAWVRAQLPHRAEWAAARARLAPAPRRHELVGEVQRGAERHAGGAARYWEHGAVALSLCAARDHRLAHTARSLHAHFPHNALLALAAGAAPAWSAAGPPRTHVAALAHVLPALLAAAPRWEDEATTRLAAGCARAVRGGAAGGVVHALRVEAEARLARGAPHAALLGALDELPNHRELYVRGAACCPQHAPALADALLERGLRAHALRDELHHAQ